MDSVTYKFLPDELAPHCATVQDIFASEEKKNGTLDRVQIAYWSAFIQKINNDWKAITDNPNYFDPDVLKTVFLLTKVPEVWALIENSPAACAMLWIHQGLEAEPNNPPIPWSPASPLPSPRRFRSPLVTAVSRLRGQIDADSYLSPYAETRSSSKFVDSPFGISRPDSLPVLDDISRHCLTARQCLASDLDLASEEIEYWKQFIEQLNTDWKKIAKRPHFLDAEVLETLFLLTACPEIWDLIETSPAVCAMLWIRQGLYAEQPEVSPSSYLSPPPSRISNPRTPDFRAHLPSPLSVPSRASPRLKQSFTKLQESHHSLSKPRNLGNASGYPWTTLTVGLVTGFALGLLTMDLYYRSGLSE